jgi:hypothetical protein
VIFMDITRIYKAGTTLEAAQKGAA